MEQKNVVNMENTDKTVEIKEGEMYYAVTPLSQPQPMMTHIDYVLPSKVYADEVLIVYRVFGKHRQWWHHAMCSIEEMRFYIQVANNELTKKQ
jgi:hypothetical protein